MIKLIIASGMLWWIGNIIWDKFGMYEPKLFYVPLSIFITVMILYIKKSISEREKRLHIIFQGMFALAIGNVVKQVFYSDKIKQINDYWFAGLVFIITLYLLIQCPTQKKNSSGMK